MTPPLTDSAVESASFCISELLWGWIPELLSRWAERVRARLIHCEQKEPLLYERETYRLALWVVELANDEGRYAEDPFFWAHWRMYGQTPDNLQQKIEAYRAWMLRNELPPKKKPVRLSYAGGSTKVGSITARKTG